MPKHDDARRRLQLGRETLRTLGGPVPPGAAAGTCMGECSCLCIPDTVKGTAAAEVQ